MHTHLDTWRLSTREVLKVGMRLEEPLLRIGINLVQGPIRRLCIGTREGL